MCARSSCTLNFVVSSTMSATLRIGSSRLRSARIDCTTVSLRPIGCGRRVSENRRTSASSLASRNTTRVGSTLRTFFRIAGNRSSRIPSRTSTTSAARSISGRLPHQVRKPRNQFQRQIIHRVVAQVLKRLQRRQLSRPRQPVRITSSPCTLASGQIAVASSRFQKPSFSNDSSPSCSSC